MGVGTPSHLHHRFRFLEHTLAIRNTTTKKQKFSFFFKNTCPPALWPTPHTQPHWPMSIRKPAPLGSASVNLVMEAFPPSHQMRRCLPALAASGAMVPFLGQGLPFWTVFHIVLFGFSPQDATKPFCAQLRRYHQYGPLFPACLSEMQWVPVLCLSVKTGSKTKERKRFFQREITACYVFWTIDTVTLKSEL